MNWAQFKVPVSHMFLAGTAVASWSLTLEAVGSSPFTVMTNIFVRECESFLLTSFHHTNIIVICQKFAEVCNVY